MENQEKEAFHYTYSAKQQAEIRAIRKKYSAPEEDKMARLRRLDASASQKATAASLAVGIVGAMLLGIGMSLVLSGIGLALGMSEAVCMLIGIPIGVIGIATACAAYPLYNRVLHKEQKKIAPEILRLTEELLQ